MWVVFEGFVFGCLLIEFSEVFWIFFGVLIGMFILRLLMVMRDSVGVFGDLGFGMLVLLNII